jgi:dihydroorotate dehydrogenase (fumarate)
MNTELNTNYLGLRLANPVVVSACPLVGELDVLRRLVDHGAAAAVLPSVFEEQVAERDATTDGASYAEMETAAYFNELKAYNRGPACYLKYLETAKKAVSIPLIGSMNVHHGGDWVQFARRIQEAGADALELNAYLLVTDFSTTSREVEAKYVELVAAVRDVISIPLAVKIGPYFTALPNMARRLVEVGADGLVLFNRFLQPDIDLDQMRVVPRLSLSNPDDMRLALRWIGLLHGRVGASLAATTGIHFADDAIRMLMAGADVVMVASTLYRHGVESLATLVGGIETWLEGHDYRSVNQIRGMCSQLRCPDREAFARANYAKAISSYAMGSEAAT